MKQIPNTKFIYEIILKWPVHQFKPHNREINNKTPIIPFLYTSSVFSKTKQALVMQPNHQFRNRIGFDRRKKIIRIKAILNFSRKRVGHHSFNSNKNPQALRNQ